MMLTVNTANAQFFKNVLKTLEKVAEVTGADSQQQADTQGQTAATAQNGSTTISLNAPGIEAKLTGGTRAGTTVTYDVVLINKTGKSREVSITKSDGCIGYEDYKSFATDDQYEQHELGSEMNVVIGDKTYTGSSSFLLSAEVPVKMHVNILNVAESCKTIPYVSLSFRGMTDATSYGQALLKIKNLPLQ